MTKEVVIAIPPTTWVIAIAAAAVGPEEATKHPNPLAQVAAAATATALVVMTFATAVIDALATVALAWATVWSVN